MSIGKEEARQGEMWLRPEALPRSPGHPFYEKLGRVLGEAGFDAEAERLCAPYYAEGGRPSIRPGVYFRMLLVGYFEGLDSQRGIAWRCADSLSLKTFLGLEVTEESPDHSSLTRIRQRLPLSVHEEMFVLVLRIAKEKKLLRGKTLLVDSTTLEANAAMKSIVRKDTGEDWNAYLERLAKAEGIEEPTQEDLRRYDRNRKGKKVSNAQWESKTDADSRIAKMKDGRTHLAYKAEHAIEAESGLILAVGIEPADAPDGETLKTRVVESQVALVLANSEKVVEEVVADKGYHKTETLAWLESWTLRSYIPERQTKQRRNWKGKPIEHKNAYYANRRRVKGKRGKFLQRKRSEFPERSFAHVCETGGARRSWLRGRINILKRYLIQIAAHNLGAILRALFGVGTPRSLQGGNVPGIAAKIAACACLIAFCAIHIGQRLQRIARIARQRFQQAMAPFGVTHSGGAPFSTGC